MSRSFDKLKSFLQKKLQPILLKGVKATTDEELIIEIDPDYIWKQTKSRLLLGDDLLFNADGSPNPEKREIIGILLDNFKKHNDKIELTFGNTHNNAATLNKVILPVMRSMLPKLLLWELIGITPLVEPTGFVKSLRYTPDGNVVTTDLVATKPQRLSARWSFEAVDEEKKNKEYYKTKGIYIEAEIMAALSTEICAETNHTFLNLLRSLAKKNSVSVNIDWNSVTNADGVVDTVIKQTETIGLATYGKVGNWVVVSPTVWAIIAQHEKFEKVGEKMPSGGFAGKLNNTINVYIDPYASDITPILVGHKGTSAMDNGVQYCPYIPINGRGFIIDPSTFEPVLAFVTNYGVYEMQSTEDMPVEAADYYALVELTESVLN
jgi:hypothetical protein